MALEDFRGRLHSQLRQAFEGHHRRLRNLVMIYGTQLSFDDFLSSRRFKQEQHQAVWRCYEQQTEEALSLEALRECLATRAKPSQGFRGLKERAFFMSLFSVQRKMAKCAEKFRVEDDAFLDCEWTIYSKINRRLRIYWLDKLGIQSAPNNSAL